MTRTEACEIAGHVFSELLGTKPIEYDASTQSAYSVRHRSIIREWSVLCSTQDGQYLLRINADTRRVYAINRMDDLNSPTKPQEALLSGGEFSDARLSHSQAEARARDYIGLIGISSQNLITVKTRPQKAVMSASNVIEPAWNFTFRNSAKQTHNHLVIISVRSEDGRLEHLWNPVLSL